MNRVKRCTELVGRLRRLLPADQVEHVARENLRNAALEDYRGEPQAPSHQKSGSGGPLS